MIETQRDWSLLEIASEPSANLSSNWRTVSSAISSLRGSFRRLYALKTGLSSRAVKYVPSYPYAIGANVTRAQKKIERRYSLQKMLRKLDSDPEMAATILVFDVHEFRRLMGSRWSCRVHIHVHWALILRTERV
jgi:hypothetical protein